MNVTTNSTNKNGCFSNLIASSQASEFPSSLSGSLPFFGSMRFGDHDYLRLHEGTPDRIRLGADDESEMGVTHRLYAPQRESNLRIRLDEYLRFGLAADRFFAT